MKRFVLAGVVALAGLSVFGAANAADLGRPMPAKAPIYAPPVGYNWTGFYAGINGGGGWGGSQWSSPVGTSGTYDISGGLVGGTAGYNWQYNNIVFGLEGDLDWSNIRGSGGGPGCPVGSCQTRNDWLGTVRGRVGYAFDRFMPYVTGGLAVGDIKAEPAGAGSTSQTNAGWTVGGGLEVALMGPLTGKIEYLYTDLGKGNCGAAVCPAGTDVNFHTNIVRAGLNYRF
ncbi:MAG TPA: outer membrane protein [Pseudolabrys sp.]|nr:outer membrane protein [Pseudolabrys sp.]